ncbi:MAG: hypothetical protein IPP78_12515 [Holophagaceae bacterium]|nr:hypothetical protein [Holophagaceae bacterium]
MRRTLLLCALSLLPLFAGDRVTGRASPPAPRSRRSTAWPAPASLW